ncbi:hypothetical protein D3C78_879280 [compost metagenome]
MLGDEGVVAVVTRVRTQLGGASIQVTDLQVQAHGESASGHQYCQCNAPRRPAAPGEVVQQAPHRVLLRPARLRFFGAQATARTSGADADIGKQHRQQDQVGEDQHRHAEAGDDGKVLDHLDTDDHQHRKTHCITQQRSEPGQEQPAEGEARRHQAVHAAADVLHDAVHLLCAMAHADGEHQKRHQHRVRVQFVSQHRQQAHLPDHCHQ